MLLISEASSCLPRVSKASFKRTIGFSCIQSVNDGAKYVTDRVHYNCQRKDQNSLKMKYYSCRNYMQRARRGDYEYLSIFIARWDIDDELSHEAFRIFIIRVL